MRWPSVFLAALAGLEAARAHGDGPHPKMVMPRRRSVEELRRMRDSHERRGPPPTAENGPRVDDGRVLEARQEASTTAVTVGDNVNCGLAYNSTSCASGYCCSGSGWCGTGPQYCNAPDCQINYGPACDGNQKPSGRDTSGDPRPLMGSVPYGGVGIYNCVNDGDVAITYDDGPYIYTAAMLDVFKAHGAVATWFITGNNLGKGMINVAYAGVIQRMVAEGHQIASHTWSHQNLDSLTLQQRQDQMVYNEIAFADILGFYPTYMRPPYSICGAECVDQMTRLGYHITFFDLDTQGYLHTDPSQIGFSVGLWDAAMAARSPCNGSYLHIEHDIHEQVATTLTNHILDSVVANGWNAVTVGTCLGDPPANWYRGSVPAYNFNITPVSAPVCSSTAAPTSASASASGAAATANGNATVAAAVSKQSASTDGRCGTVNGKACLGSVFGSCCSQYGYCGNTNGHCGAGCQAGFGNCTAAAAVVLPSSPLAGNTTAAAVLTSLDGHCGTAYGNTSCAGSVFGGCCSQYGYCGSTDGHCGAGCQSGFGSCGESDQGTARALDVPFPAPSLLLTVIAQQVNLLYPPPPVLPLLRTRSPSRTSPSEFRLLRLPQPRLLLLRRQMRPLPLLEPRPLPRPFLWRTSSLPIPRLGHLRQGLRLPRSLRRRLLPRPLLWRTRSLAIPRLYPPRQALRLPRPLEHHPPHLLLPP
ncbi:glycoside hydrolase/deacetylase [Colletotrichum falcatum]|nr:glycoside hydrolase/deacetylase [Colletotrichum falcatum]